jgi:VWFA-related protein
MYTIGLFDENSADRNPGVLKQLARQTGGLVYLPENLTSLTGICSQIARDIRNQYTVSYNSPKASSDAAFHRIKVTATDSNGRQLRVRSRSGFYGVKSPSEADAQSRPLPQ